MTIVLKDSNIVALGNSIFELWYYSVGLCSILAVIGMPTVGRQVEESITCLNMAHLKCIFVSFTPLTIMTIIAFSTTPVMI